MAFIMVPVATAPVLTGYSTPYRMSFCVSSDNTDGGDLFLNCQGVEDPTVTDAVDLPTFFGTSFNSQDAAAVLKRAAANATEATDLIVPNLDIQITATSGASLGMVAWTPVGGIGAAPGVPFIHLIAPIVAGTWRIDIVRRHSFIY